MPCGQKTTGLRSATAPPAPAKRSAALRRTHPTSVPRSHYPCLAHPVARSGLPPPEQNTRPPPGLFNMGLQCGFAHYESLYCSMRFSCDFSPKWPKNRVFGLVEPVFRAFFIIFAVAEAIWRPPGVLFFYFLRRRQIDYIFSSNDLPEGLLVSAANKEFLSRLMF